MNAGAYGSEMSKIVKSVRSMDSEGKVKELSAEQCGFGYRKSVFCENGDIILSGILRLESGDGEKIREYTRELAERRVSKQPLDKPSAGSTFKRPEGYFAGKLIEDCGLKGFSIGGAKVSEKHAGFVINYNNATTADITNLIKHIQKTVKEKTGVSLETEVKLLP